MPALLALFVPVVAQLAIKTLAGRQRRAFSEQLPDNLQVIASAMRSGQTFVGALKAVIEDAPEPSKRELRRAVLDEQLGIPLADALGQVTERMKSEDFKHVAIVAALQRETGGNTAEVIDLVAETVRERIEIRRLVRGLTAQGRLSGGILSLLPVGLLIFISMMNPALRASAVPHDTRTDRARRGHRPGRVGRLGHPQDHRDQGLSAMVRPTSFWLSARSVPEWP